MSGRGLEAFVFAISICIFAACGGTAVVDGANGNAGSSAGTGTARAGAPSSAGASPGGGASSSAGSGGAAPLDACSQPQVSGPCEAAFAAYWHNPETGVCEPFTYGGCQGNDNRYETLEDCNRACNGLGPDYDRCDVDGQCSLQPVGCCAACEPASERQFVSVRLITLSQYKAASCPGDVACAPCPSVPDTQSTGKYLKPVCVDQHCAIADVRRTPAFTGCETDADCSLRAGTGCCARCDGTGWLAVNETADFCGGAFVECGCSAPKPPSLLVAKCEEHTCVANLLLK